MAEISDRSSERETHVICSACSNSLQALSEKPHTANRLCSTPFTWEPVSRCHQNVCIQNSQENPEWQVGPPPPPTHWPGKPIGPPTYSSASIIVVALDVWQHFLVSRGAGATVPCRAQQSVVVWLRGHPEPWSQLHHSLGEHLSRFRIRNLVRRGHRVEHVNTHTPGDHISWRRALGTPVVYLRASLSRGSRYTVLHQCFSM